MLNIGELYYFDNQLDSNLDIGSIEIFGVDSSLIKDNQNSSLDNLLKIKDNFIISYGLELKKSKLNESHQIWKQITGIFVENQHSNSNEKLSSTSPFATLAKDLEMWVDEGQKTSELEQIIVDFSVESSSNLELFTIYYGLRVLNYITNKYNFGVGDTVKTLDQFKLQDSYKNLLKVDEMVAVCQSNLSPLFLASDIDVIIYSSDYPKLLNTLKVKLETDPNLNVILTLGIDDETLAKLKKVLGNQCLICTIPESVSSDNKTNFFAELGLKTIGISESNIKTQL